MANTGRFFLYDVLAAASMGGDETYPRIHEVRADCLSCHHAFTATAEPFLANISGGGISVACSECGSRQAIAGARLADCRARTSGSAMLYPGGLGAPAISTQMSA